MSKITGIVRAIENGAYNPPLGKRLPELKAMKAETEAKLADLTPAPVLAIYPNLPELYGRKVAALERALGTLQPATRLPRSSRA